MSLPKGFKRLEYIQSSGTQYFNTGFAPNSNSRVVMDVETIGVSSMKALFGTRNASSATASLAFVVWQSAATTARADCFGTSKTATGTFNSRMVVDMNKNVCTINGVSVANTATSGKQATLNLYLLACNNSGTATASYMISAKLYSCQIYDNETLVRDFVPCENTSGAVGLWDDVDGKFYGNAGTGTFAAGPVISVAVDESEITEIEYIQSSGTQYVDTGYVWTNESVKTEIGFEYLAVGNNTLFGTYKAATAEFGICPWVESGTTNVKFFAGTSTNLMATPIAVNTPYELVCVTNNKTLSIDLNGIQKSSAYSGTIQTGQTVALFADNMTAGVSQYSKMKLRYFRMYDNGTLVRDYIPAMLANGEVGLYDRVFHEFCRNAGTGEFIAGPVKITTPKAPANFRVESAEGERVTLAWNASETALGYRLYRAGALLTDTTETTATVTVEPFAGAVFTLTAYNENGEGAGAELTYFNAPDDPILFLVTDRTQQDVTERNQKGYYAASDLNRVGFAVKYLAGRLKDSGVSVTVSPVLTWTDEKWATPTAMTAYLKDVQTMRNALKVAEATPTAPEDMAKLTYSEANDIEAILVALDVHITRMLSIVNAGWASGLAYTGFYAKEAY